MADNNDAAIPADEPPPLGEPAYDSGPARELDISTEENGGPHLLWYFAHVLFWVITGLACYIIYHKTHPKKARRHLITSIWLSPAIMIIAGLLAYLIFPDDAGMLDL